MSNKGSPLRKFGMVKSLNFPLGGVFLRGFMFMWEDLSSVGESIVLTDDEDHILWSFSSSGHYSVQSLYAIINHRGVVPVFIHAVWKLSIFRGFNFFFGYCLAIGF